MEEKNTGQGTQGAHGIFRTPDRPGQDAAAKPGAQSLARAQAVATPAHARNPIRRRLPPVPDWVWNLARWTALAGGVTGAGLGLLFAGHGGPALKIAFAILGGVFGAAFGLFGPLALFWISVVAMVGGLALGAIALIVWLVRRAGHH